MKIYAVRWENGDASIVAARNRTDGICVLDQWGKAGDPFAFWLP